MPGRAVIYDWGDTSVGGWNGGSVVRLYIDWVMGLCVRMENNI